MFYLFKPLHLLLFQQMLMAAEVVRVLAEYAVY